MVHNSDAFRVEAFLCFGIRMWEAGAEAPRGRETDALLFTSIGALTLGETLSNSFVKSQMNNRASLKFLETRPAAKGSLPIGEGFMGQEGCAGGYGRKGSS